MRVKSSLTARARSVNRATAAERATSSRSSCSGEGRSRGARETTRSPVMRRASREVTTSLRAGASVSRAETSGAASMTCSKLSRISSISLEERWSARLCCSVRPGVSLSARVWAMRRDDEGGIVKGGEVDEEDPVGKEDSSCAPRAAARLVLPVPPGPTRVTTEVSWGSEQLFEGGEVLFSADERSQAWGQVGGMGALGAQGGEVLGQARGHDLEKLRPLLDVLERVAPQRTQSDVF